MGAADGSAGTVFAEHRARLDLPFEFRDNFLRGLRRDDDVGIGGREFSRRENKARYAERLGSAEREQLLVGAAAHQHVICDKPYRVNR